MVAMDLQGAFERGEPLAVPDAAQYPLYGRFGFGPATTMAWFEIDVHWARLAPRRTADVSGVLLVDAREYLKAAPAVYERLRAVQPGALRRDEQWWLDTTGQRSAAVPDRPEPFFALYLGDESATRLAALGGTEEVRSGALARADAMFREGRRPWSPRAVPGPRSQAGAP